MVLKDISREELEKSYMKMVEYLAHHGKYVDFLWWLVEDEKQEKPSAPQPEKKEDEHDNRKSKGNIG